MKLNGHLEPNQMIVDDDTEEVKEDSETMIKCLTIMCTMMRVKSVQTLIPTLRCLVNVALTSLDVSSLFCTHLL